MATHMGASTFFSPCFLTLQLQSPRPSSVKTTRIFIVRSEQKSGNKNKQGWFYNTFVANQTMDAKLDKFKGDVAAKNGFVGSWFDDSFKYTAWIEVHRKLTERNLKSIECKEAQSRAKFNGAILLDVRESQDFEKVHAEGACNAPLFRLIQGDSLKSNMRFSPFKREVLLKFGYLKLKNTSTSFERNPEFINQAMDAVGGDKRKVVVVMCQIGGTLLTYVERGGAKYKKFADPERKFGRQSRSLKAIYELQEAGFKNVLHLKDGLNQWIHEGFPIDGLNE
uniref:Rhodanese domain-containing protein n=1 Tax=Picea sitchensis TaxID=3332 RepID=B8LMI9_PICSI|nr:unknown [Picea sitchensis]